jgi:hypothetical protein
MVMMATRYLLPCGCGQKVPVGVHQAGLNVTCGCGRELEVPTRRAITQLEPKMETVPGTAPRGGRAAVPVGAAGGAWGLRQRLQFLSAVLLVAAAVGWGYLWVTWPKDEIGPQIAGSSPAHAMEFWQALRGGIDVRQNPASLEIMATIENYGAWQKVCLGGAGVGLLLFGSSFLVRQGKSGKS